MSEGLLAGERVLITGGSGGIGRGICEVAAREGAKVAFVWNTNEAGAQETEAALRALGAEVLAIQADLTLPQAAQEVVAQVEEAWEGIDGLVNNAGFSEAVPFVLLEDEDMQNLLELNLLAPFRLTRAALRGMIRRKHGRIVNLSSITGTRTIPGPVHYATSKGAILQMSRTLALEWAPHGITVNCVLPGPFGTEMNQSLLDDPEAYKSFVSRIPLGRWGNLDEIGGLIVFLASDASSFITGAGITIDGGWTVQ